jgi:uncharacterized protein
MQHLTNWVEIPVKNMNRAVKFYSTVLGGVTLNELELGPVKYALFPSDDKYNCGALAQGEYYTPSADGVVIYLDGGRDLDQILSRVVAAGGTVVMEKTFLADEAGYIGMFLDTEGNKIGLQNPK